MKRTVLPLLISAWHTQDWGNLQNVQVEFLFSANPLRHVDQGIIWATNRISQGACSETAAKIEVKWRLLQIVLAWCCDNASNCMELSYMRNRCWLFCDSWIECMCSSKWTWWWWWWWWRRWWQWWQRQWKQQCGWQTKLWYLVAASGKNKHQSHFWRVYLNCWYLSAFEKVDRG